MLLSREQLLQIMPNCDPAKAQAYAAHLSTAMAEAEINTPIRAAAFLGQLAHESGELRWWVEHADGSAYEGRRNLGNTESGDGHKFLGRGPIQLTGRANYRAAGQALGVPLEDCPDRAADPDVGFRVAAWYWTTHRCNQLADEGDIAGVTRAINGGHNGLAARIRYRNRAIAVLQHSADEPGKVSE